MRVYYSSEIVFNVDRFDQFLKQHKEPQRRISNSNPKLAVHYDKLLRMKNSHFTCIHWKYSLKKIDAVQNPKNNGKGFDGVFET